MATTAGKLRAVVTADVADGVKKLREFGGELDTLHRKAATQTDGIAGLFKKLAIGAAVIGGIKVAGDVISGVFGAIKNTAGEALQAVASYEQLFYGLRQLTASQIIGAGAAKDMATALTMAEQPAKELINWVEQLAVKSPFTSDEVAQAFRMAEAFGFNESQAKRLTQAMTDFSAGAGLSGDYINRIMLNMGQMAAAGKITSREIKDMAMAGLPVKSILAESFGVTQAKMEEMIEKGAVPVGKAFEAITSFLETRFKGAAERMTGTWQGMMSSLEDIKKIDLRELFGGVFAAIQPEMNNIVNFLGSDNFRQALRSIGTALGEAVKDGVAVGKKALATMFDSDGLSDFMQKIKSGDFNTAIHDIVGKIEFGVLNAISIAKEVATILFAVGQYVGELLKVFISNLSNLLTIFGNVIDTKIEALATRAEAMIRFNASPAYNQAAADAAGAAEMAQGNFGNYLLNMQKELAPAYDVMIGKINEAKTQREKETKSIDEQRAAYYALATARQAAEKGTGVTTNAGRGMRDGGRFDPRTGKYAEDPMSKVAGTGGFDTFTNTATDTGEKAGKKMADAMGRAIDKMLDGVKTKMQRGVDVSINLGKMPGTDPLAAGSDGPFEKLYRLQDVAMNLGKPSQGKDTVKWYQEYFNGQSFEEASKQAAAIVTQFQRGNFTDDVLKYVDIDKLRAIQSGETDAAASQDRLAKLVGGDSTFLKKMLGTDKDLAGAGGVLSEKDAESLARNLKTGVVTGLDKINSEQPTVMSKLLGGVTAQGKDGKSAVDFGGTLVPSLVAAIDAELASGGSKLEEKGAQAWGLMEKGFVDQAKKSMAFTAAVAAMVENSLENYLPTN